MGCEPKDQSQGQKQADWKQSQLRNSPWESGDMLWQHLRHRWVSPHGQGPCCDSTRAWMGPQKLMDGRKVERSCCEH